MNVKEMLKASADSGSRPLTELPARVQQLQSTLETLPESINSSIEQAIAPTIVQMTGFRASLQELPAAVAEQLMEVIGPLTELPEQVRKALDSFDRITQAQRSTLGEMTEQITLTLPPLIEARLMPLTASINEATQAVTNLQQATQHLPLQIEATLAPWVVVIAQATTAAAALDKIRADLDESTVLLQQANIAVLERQESDNSKALEAMQYLTAQVNREYLDRIAKKPPRWEMPAMLVLCITMGAFGAIVLDRTMPLLAPASSESLWSKATPQEIEFLKKIDARPAK